jgi:hypothetical protein
MVEMPDHRHRARALLAAMDDPAEDLESLVQRARLLFDAAGMGAHERWLELELDGYSSAQARTLSQVLGLSPTARLPAHVQSYRMQTGIARGGAIFHHFFAEPLSELVQANAAVRQLPSRRRVELEFAARRYDRLALTGSFECEVFDRILRGFREALRLHLAALDVD